MDFKKKDLETSFSANTDFFFPAMMEAKKYWIGDLYINVYFIQNSIFRTI